MELRDWRRLLGKMPHESVMPGEALRAVLAVRGSTSAWLAEETRVSTKHLSQIMTGKASITPEMALRLELALGWPTAEMWWMLQGAWSLDQISVKRAQGPG